VRFLLCVDDDPVLEPVLAAVRWSVEISDWDQLIVLHVVPKHPLRLVGGDLPPAKIAASFLEHAEHRLSDLSVPVDTVLAQGDPAQEILRLADEREADLIVMGALGEPRDFLMGSVSQKVVSLAGIDVLVVRESTSRSHDLMDGYRALVAVDGSRGAEAGIEAFAGKLRAERAAIRLVHVVESLPTLRELASERDRVESSLERQSEELLSRALKLLGRYGLEAECESRRGSPATQILEVSRERNADLIVVGSRGQTGFRDMVLGTITQRVLRNAPCSVLCARSFAPDSAALQNGWSSGAWQVGMA